MSDFKGKIRIEDGDGLEATLTVDSGRLMAKAGEHEIGNWAVDELSVERRNSEFLFQVEGEELVVDVADPVGLAQILEVKENEPKKRRGKKSRASRPKRKERSAPAVQAPPVAPAASVVTAPVMVSEPPPVAPPAAAVTAPAFVAEPAPIAAADKADAAADGPSLWERTPMRTKLIGLGVIGFVIFFFVAPSLLALLLLLAGLATLFLAIAAKGESGSGILPPPFFGTNAAIAGGFGSVLLSLLIMVIT